MNTCKLIFRNVCKNIRDYLIYFLTLTLSVSLFYAFNSISDQPAFSNMGMTGTLLYRQLGIMLSTLSTMIAVVLAFLILYANQFLLKRRKKEFILYAIGSAVFAALTSILAKVGITGVESNLGTAIRTIVVLVMAWLLVLIKKKAPELKHLDKKELGFIGLSGVATGASWLCYYYAIQNGIVSVVVPIDKMSLLVTVIFSYLAFHERLSKKALVGLVLMLAGTLAMAVFS